MSVAARDLPTADRPVLEEMPVVRSVPPSLVLVGAVTVLVGAWGGIAPYVGPTFGFSADASSAWRWTTAHAVLALAPGVVAVAAGLVLLMRAGSTVVGRGRVTTGLAGLLAALCGAWFVVGEFAWPVIDGRHYFVGAAPYHFLLEQLGFAVGTGVVLVACGAYAMGWAARHHVVRAVHRNRPARRTATLGPVPSGPVATEPAAPGEIVQQR